jgi:hypothetical protein
LGRVRFFRSELAERFKIFLRAFEFAERVQQRTDARYFLDVTLGALAIRPKIRAAHSLFERGELAL